MNEYLILVVVSSLCAVAAASCPFNDEEEWKEFQVSCYYFSEVKYDRDTARNFCLQQRNWSHLADILTPEENAWIHERLNGHNYPENYYIGATDLEVEGVFRWDNTGDTFGYSNWEDGEPNQWRGDPENCVEMKTRSGEWNDVPCDLPKRFICKRASLRNLP
ncbi:collectin-12-like [Mizuhopecten yessoensis]|uniref:Collectin-12 n=1 Tax=Mizuhopecten yessoensis TaxID=6573 RepID=A0A210PVZ4_MIZYE|nr:collectin-12-like [Mizuhopecten yessoensis]OWF40661.1 Collectin-12 [Mizuhopecten yessoensis]